MTAGDYRGHMNTLRATLAVAALLALAGCGGTQSEPEATSPTPREAVATTTAEPTTASAECTPASQALLDRIATGALDGTGMVPLSGEVYLSPDYGKAYFVAVKFSATGIEDQTGVWVTNDLEFGTTMSVDGTAINFTDWPEASKTDPNLTIADPTASVVIECLG